MTADDNLRDEIAAALRDFHGQASHPVSQYHCEADVLLPVVERLQRQAAAKALREAADWVWAPAGDAKAIHDELQNRADGIEAT